MVGDLAAERRKNLDILSSVVKKRAVLDAEKAANRHTAMEQRRSVETYYDRVLADLLS